MISGGVPATCGTVLLLLKIKDLLKILGMGGNCQLITWTENTTSLNVYGKHLNYETILGTK